VYDPAAMESARQVLVGNVIFAPGAAECAGLADAPAIPAAGGEFKTLPAADLKTEPAVPHSWRVLDARAFSGRLRVPGCGAGAGIIGGESLVQVEGR
jgi:hypothetical protein